MGTIGVSVFPTSLDTDANLIRNISTDALVPAVTNNKLDAIEAIEATVGVTDCTKGGTIAAQFTAPIAQYLHVASVAGTNPRYPFGVPPAPSVYGTEGALPGTAVLGSGCTVDFAAAFPFFVLNIPATFSGTALKLPFTSVAAWTSIIRMREFGPWGGGLLFVGMQDSGATHNNTFRLRTPTAASSVIGDLAVNEDGGAATSVAASPVMNPPHPWFLLRTDWDGTHFTHLTSPDGILFDTYIASVGSTAPDEFCIIATGDGTQAMVVLIDFIAIGPAL